jgi:nucleoside-diphosphate-sugar epimerase
VGYRYTTLETLGVALEAIMKILLTGSGGYIGVLMGPYLENRGHEVTGLDTGYFQEVDLYPRKEIETINKDTRKLEEEDLVGYDAVVHLAELSNDPLGDLDREITFKINHHGTVRLAKLAKEAGVKRFIHSSSCSVYGMGEPGEVKTEKSRPIPLTAYAECKVLVEKEVSEIADVNFTPVFLRNATVYGPSPRMRFDLVLNNLSGWPGLQVKLL